jgi:hypothetical protein
MGDESNGIEFFLELNAKIDQGLKMVAELTKVQAASIRAAKGLDDAEKKAGMLDKAFKGAATAASNFVSNTLAHFTALASFEGLKRIGDGLFDMGKEAFQAAGEAERLRRSYEILLGDKPADTLLEYLDDLAKHTEFTDGKLKDFAGELLRAGFAGDELKKALAATADLAAFPGDKMANAANALGLLSRIQLRGAVAARELTSANISPKVFFERVAKETGIGVKSVEKAIGEGKVRTNDLLTALYKTIQAQTGGPLGTAAVAMSKTFLAQKEKVGDIIPNLFEELEKSGGLKGITGAMAQLSAAFDPSAPAGQKLVVGLTKMVDKFAELVNGIDINAFADKVVSFLEKLPDLFDKTIEGLKVLLDVANGVGTALGWVGKNIGEGVGHVVTGEAPLPLGDGMFMDPSDLAPKAEAEGKKIGGATWHGMVNSQREGLPMVWKSAEDMAKFSQRAVKEENQIRSPSKVFERFGAQTAEGFALGIEKSSPGMAGRVADSFSLSSLVPTPAGAGGVAAGAAMARPSGPTFSAAIEIHIAGLGGDAAEQRDGAELVGTTVRRHLESLFERMAAEGGAT